MGYTLHDLGYPDESVMKLTVPPFSFHQVPTPRDMATNLVCAIPEPERKDASEVLVVQILPVKLAGIDKHPRPERLSAVVYKELARILSAKPPNMRLHTLKLYAVGTEIQRLAKDALNLAIARFLDGNTGALDAEKLERWLTDPVQDLRMLSGQELAERAREMHAELGAWKERVTSEYPTEWDKHRVKHQQVRATLQAADTGSFDAATGSFLDFLRDAGRDPQELSIE